MGPSGAPSGGRKAERKRATVMFADLVGFTELSADLGPERAYAIVTECLKRLDGIARRHGGAVDKYLGDCLMAVFGHPVPLDDDAGAAVGAASEMRRLVRDYVRELRLEVPLDIHIGINTGPLVTGELRGGARREFHVLGDTVNIAARLKQRAPVGSVYVGAETEERTRDRFDYEALEALELKGKSARVPTFALSGSQRGTQATGRGAELFAATLVGRSAELQQLRACAYALGRGRGGVVYLSGEEGVGKSRLAAELCRADELGAMGILEAASARSDSALATPAALVRGWAGIASGSHSEAALERLAAGLDDLMGGAAETLLPIFGELLGLREGRRALGRSDRRSPERLAEAMARWLTALAARRPTLVLLDDLQDADPASIEVIDRLVALTAQHPLLFLLVSRPGGSRAGERLLETARQRDPEGCAEIQLHPLAEAESETLMEELPEARELPSEIRAAIRARAGGNPRRLILGTFLAPAVREEQRRDAGADRSQDTERRRATVVFADLTGFTSLTESLGDDEAYGLVADSLALLDEVASRHGGTVDKYLGDCVMALFGVPEAIEDAPRAALNAAIEMRDRIREFNRERGLDHPLDVHTGINTGLAIAGDISGPMIREFALMGEPVDFANRLSDLAPAGRIFVGPETHRFTRDVFDFRPTAPVELAAGGSPVPAWELTSERQRVYRRRAGADRAISSALVGRDSELGTLRGVLEAASRGEGGVVSLIGEAGLGKSRILEELRASDEARALDWLVGRSLSVGAQLSYHPFEDLLRSWSGITDEDPDEALPGMLEQALSKVFGEETTDVYPFLASVMGLRLTNGARSRIDAVAGNQLQRILQRQVASLLRRLSEARPLVLVFDDLHWADLSSVELLESLLGLVATSPIAIVNVFRPGFATTSERIRTLAREQISERHVEIELGPLGTEAARDLINNLFRQADIPYGVRRQILERSSGNPLYVEEVVRSLIEEGAVEVVGGALRVTAQIHQAVIPATVGEVVMARFDRLEPVPKQVLRVAAVVGGSFHAQVLEQIFEEKDELHEVLESLRDAEFIVPWDRLQGVEYAFKSPLIQEVVYDGLIQASREELHLRVGRAIESSLTENVPGFHAMLAYHYSLGRDTERAETWLFRAGDEAARSAASNEALHFFREASRLYFEVHGEGGDPRRKALLEKNVGMALYNRGQIEEACTHFDRALEHLGRRVLRKPAALQARFARDLLLALARLYVPGARQRLAASETKRDVVDIMHRRGQGQAIADPARFVFDTMATVCEVMTIDPATLPQASEALSGAVGIFSFGGISFGIGRRFLDVARESCRASGEPPGLLYRVMDFLHHFLEGDWSSEHEIDDESLAAHVRNGRLWEVGTYLSPLANKLSRQGRFDRAIQVRELYSEIWETYGYEGARIGYLAGPMELGLQQRRLQALREAAVRYYEENPFDIFQLLGLSYLATGQVLDADLDGAEESLEKAGAILKRTGQIVPYHRGAYWLARFRFDLARLETAPGAELRDRERMARRSAKPAWRLAMKVAMRQAEVARLCGRLEWLRGRHDEALRWWQRSLEIAERLGARPDLARTCREVGRHLRQEGGDVELGGHGSEHYLERARGLLAELGLGTEFDSPRR